MDSERIAHGVIASSVRPAHVLSSRVSRCVETTATPDLGADRCMVSDPISNPSCGLTILTGPKAPMFIANESIYLRTHVGQSQYSLANVIHLRPFQPPRVVRE